MKLRRLTQEARELVEGEDKPFISNLREQALKNTDFRRVVYTGKKVQFTVMSIPPEGEVGAETHKNVEQVFFCVAGAGEANYGGKKSEFSEGDVLVVPPGTNHNIENTGEKALKFYTSYSPPNHLPDTVHKTKADADADDADEAFGQKVAKEQS
jgi:mannose-6-phosphate isomerase-like protein (cupin superfamily)